MSISQLRRSHNARHVIADQVNSDLARFEADLNQALTSGTQLLGRLPQARQEAQMSPTVGHEAVSHIAASLALISDAMSKAALGHNGLETVASRFRIAVTAGGDKDTTDPWKRQG